MHYIQITPEGALPDVSRHAPFMAVIAPEEKLEDARQAEIARWLVDSGARYVLVCGPSASRWKEAVRVFQRTLELDSENVEAHHNLAQLCAILSGVERAAGDEEAAAGELADQLEKQPSTEDIRSGRAWSPDWRRGGGYRGRWRNDDPMLNREVLNAYSNLQTTCSGCHSNFRTAWR